MSPHKYAARGDVAVTCYDPLYPTTRQASRAERANPNSLTSLNPSERR